jgi:hypothetical protein
MSMNERVEIVTSLYKLQADVSVLLAKCQTASALQVGINVQGVKNLVDEALMDLDGTKPDDPLYQPWAASVKTK